MKTVLIVSYFFPPLNNMAAKRFGVMCKYFREYGYQVVVLTSKPHVNCFLHTKLDLHVSEKIHKIIRIGLTGAIYIPESVCAQAVIQWVDKRNRQTRALSEASLGWYEKVRRELDLSELKDIDIIIGTYPSMENLFVANYLSRKLKRPFVADIRDLITEYSEDTGGRVRGFAEDALVEKMILRNAAGIVPVTNGFGRILKRKYPNKKMRVIFNGWEENPLEEKSQNGVQYLYYAGSLYDHRLESLKLLMDCLKEVAKIKDVRLKIRSVGPKELDMKMRKMIQTAHMESYIEIMEAAEEEIIKKEQAGAYINVVLGSLEEKDKALMTTVPGKLYELLSYRVPVLAIMPEMSDAARIIEKTGKGMTAISREIIVDFILHAGENYSGNRYVEFFSRKNQARRYCEFLDLILMDKTKNE